VADAELIPAAAAPPGAVDALLDLAFGPDRHARTAYRVRGRAEALGALSFAAVRAGTVIGSIQCWPVAFLPDDGATPTPLVMLGPVAVLPGLQRAGLGRRLVERALAAAAEQGLDGAMTLIGDPEYYGRFFGFTAERTGRWRLPGPFEARRLLARGPRVPGGGGVLGPRVAAAAGAGAA